MEANMEQMTTNSNAMVQMQQRQIDLQNRGIDALEKIASVMYVFIVYNYILFILY